MARVFDPDEAFRTLRDALIGQGKRLDLPDADRPGGRSLPLYRIRDADAVRKRPLASARMAAIVFPIVENGRNALATVHPTRRGYAFGGLSYGPLCDLVHQGLEFARQEVGSGRQTYRPLLLHSHSLQFLLLVLRPLHGRALFTPLLHRVPAAAEKFRFRGGLSAYLVAAHRHRRSSFNPRPMH
jgi:hypothetical protein